MTGTEQSVCECKQLEDFAVIGMGEPLSFRLMPTFEEACRRGDPWWWLGVSICRLCRQPWLIAQEERQNDVFILRRLAPEIARRIIDKNEWPNELDKYEELLEIGMKAGHSVTFCDLEDSSLIYTISDLARERPGIALSRLAALLNLRRSDAESLARKAMDKSSVVISFDS